MKRLLPLALLATTLFAQAPKISSHRIDKHGDRVKAVSGYVNGSASHRHLFDNGFPLGNQGLIGTVDGAIYKKLGNGVRVFGGAWYQHSNNEGPRELDFFTGIEKNIEDGPLAGAQVTGGYKHWDYLHQFQPGVDWASNNVGFANMNYNSFWDTRVGIEYLYLHMNGAKDGHQVKVSIGKELYLGRTNTGHEWSITPDVACVAAKNFFGRTGFPVNCAAGIKSSWRKGPLEGYVQATTNAVMYNGRKPGVFRIGVTRTF